MASLGFFAVAVDRRVSRDPVLARALVDLDDVVFEVEFCVAVAMFWVLAVSVGGHGKRVQSGKVPDCGEVP